MKISVFTTCSNPIERQDLFFESLASYRTLADELLVVDGSKTPEDIYSYKPYLEKPVWDKVIYHHWPEEYKWDFFGEQFQRGYDACVGDWVIRVDLDFVIHPHDVGHIVKLLNAHPEAPAMSFWKYQFTLVDRYNLKSRLALALNKGVYGDRITLNAGKDLCQAALDGVELIPDSLPLVEAPVWNYDFMLKTEEVVRKDFGRAARAWNRQFGNWNLGGPSESEIFDKFLQMQLGRAKKPSSKVSLEDHPRYVRNVIEKLTPKQCGHSVWGQSETASYFIDNAINTA